MYSRKRDEIYNVKNEKLQSQTSFLVLWDERRICRLAFFWGFTVLRNYFSKKKKKKTFTIHYYEDIYI